MKTDPQPDLADTKPPRLRVFFKNFENRLNALSPAQLDGIFASLVENAPKDAPVSYSKESDINFEVAEVSVARADEILFLAFVQSLARALAEHNIDPRNVNFVIGNRMPGTAGITVQRMEMIPPITAGILEVAAGHMRALAKEVLPEAAFYATGVAPTTATGRAAATSSVALSGTGVLMFSESTVGSSKKRPRDAAFADIIIMYLAMAEMDRVIMQSEVIQRESQGGLPAISFGGGGS